MKTKFRLITITVLMLLPFSWLNNRVDTLASAGRTLFASFTWRTP